MPDERILYILGAGFSAPLGIPVMGDFLNVARDLYRENPSGHPSIKQILDLGTVVDRIGKYFHADVFNIEEILSVLEMRDELTDHQLKQVFQDFIRDVIRAKTPTMTIPDKPLGRQSNWFDHAFGSGSMVPYACFAANLLSLKLTQHQQETGPGYAGLVSVERMQVKRARYAVVTLNYDLVLESVVTHLREQFGVRLGFTGRREGADPAWERAPYLVKLHGSVDSGPLIAPTWNKSHREELSEPWALAYRLIAEATKIRVVGYSLPASDNNVRYLMKAGLLASDGDLKELDVVCLDSGDKVKTNYSELITFGGRARFVSADVADYLDMHGVRPQINSKEHYALCEGLESAHDAFMAGKRPVR